MVLWCEIVRRGGSGKRRDVGVERKVWLEKWRRGGFEQFG